MLPAGGFGNFDPGIVIREGRGARIRDEDGNECVDYLIGSGPLILGHGHPEVPEAVAGQLSGGQTFFASNAAGIELAEEICKVHPAPNSSVTSPLAARRTCTPCGLPAPSRAVIRSSSSKAAITG